MKKIIEESNRSGWNHLLPDGSKLIQESGPRFGTYYQVAEGFLKVAKFIDKIIESQLSATTQTAYTSLKKTSSIDGTITGYPEIEAILDAFGVVVDCIKRFETSERPTMHVTLPFIYRMLQKPQDVAEGGEV